MRAVLYHPTWVEWSILAGCSFLFHPPLYGFHQSLSHRLHLGGEGRKGEIDGRGSRTGQNLPAWNQFGIILLPKESDARERRESKYEAPVLSSGESPFARRRNSHPSFSSLFTFHCPDPCFLGSRPEGLVSLSAKDASNAMPLKEKGARSDLISERSIWAIPNSIWLQNSGTISLP